MIAFACRARVSRQPMDWWCSILAAALLTGVKGSNLPLVLPGAILLLTLLPLWRRRWLGTILVCLVAAVISFLPIAICNTVYCGDWSGAKLEPARFTMKNPWVGIWGNSFQIVLNNFSPPVFPLAGWWNAHAPALLPQFLVNAANRYFDDGFFVLGELPTEDIAGIGFGLSLLLVVGMVASFWISRSGSPVRTAGAMPFALGRCIMISAWVALLAYCVKCGMVNAARLITPYYPLLIASMVAGSRQSQIIRYRWWQGLAGITLALSFVVLVLSPDRPLWPAKTILSKVVARHPASQPAGRALQVYSIYAKRSDALAGVRELLPPGIKTVGFIADDDDCDISLWRPFGSRRVEHFFLTDPPEQIRRQVQYVVLGKFNLDKYGMTLDAWLQASGAELVATTNIMVKIASGSLPWYVVRFKPQ
jgi:hypothetical protein